MAGSPLLKKAYWSLAVAGAFYFTFISILLNGWAQRQALYAPFFRSWWHDIEQFEQFGFLKNQIRPFNITTPDGEVLYAWHVLPLSTYITHEASLIDEPTSHRETLESSMAFKLLAEDRDSRLVISFHGNGGTVAQGWRTDTYRALSSGAPNKIHVLTIDYRGYGYSTGSPGEAGLITDGIAAVRWAMDIARIPPEQIVLLGQSLGTAVAIAVAERFLVDENLEFKGIVLVAAFSDIPTLMSTYAIAGVIPILSPLRPYPFLQQFFAKRVQETWYTTRRLEHLVRKSRNINLHLIHSKNDFDIPWTHSDTLFYAAVNATSERRLTPNQIDAVKIFEDLGKSGYCNSWKTVQENGARKSIKQNIVYHGGHNRLPTYPVVGKAVYDAFFGEDSQHANDLESRWYG